MIISTESLKEMIDSNEDFILIDVRRKNELIYGTIPKAVHLCLQDFSNAFDLSDKKFSEMYNFKKPSKDKLIIVYCRTGNRSDIAAEYLNKKGYNVKNYEGSIKAWSQIDNNVKMYE